MGKNSRSLGTLDARTQAKIAIVLMAVIPSLTLFYLGTVVGTSSSGFTTPMLLLIVLLTTSVAVPGFMILRQYPENILKLRAYITEISCGVLPEKIELANTQSSDDIKYIESNLNLILNALRARIQQTEEQLRVEQHLRKTVEEQQATLLEAERHRVMIQTLGAACHHIGQPATVLQLRMDFLEKFVTGDEEMEEFKACVKAVQSISEILHKLQQISNFRTVPYIQEAGDGPDDRILAID